MYLDVETIEALAIELGVLFEGLLGRVVAHELSHAARGHATQRNRVSQGWFNEGDAQRDAWHVLADLLADPAWATIARWGRAAQVRLADRQPAAYRYFSSDWTERSHLSTHPPVDPPDNWIVRPPRDVFVLTHEGIAEVPMSMEWRSTHMGAPHPGDLVYLGDRKMVAGAWVIVAMREKSLLMHPKDVAAIAKKGEEERRQPSIGWFLLRPFGPLHASTESAVQPLDRFLVPRKLDSGTTSQLGAHLKSGATDVAQVIADRILAGRHRTAADLAEMHRVAGKPVPDGLFAEHDPFDDWS
jgi:hypothetical protein